MILRNKTLIITGGTSGIGNALCADLIRRKNNLCVIARNEQQLKLLSKLGHECNAKVSYYLGDLTSEEDVENAYKHFKSHFDIFDGLIYCAGISDYTFAEDLSYANAKEMIYVNYLSVVKLTSLLLPEMLSKKQGLIAAISASACYRSAPLAEFYIASKSALTNFLEGLRIQLFQQKEIDVINILPGFVDTPMFRKYNHPKICVWTAQEASQHIIDGIEKGKEVIAFPWIIFFLLRLFQTLPRFIYNPLCYLAMKNIMKKIRN